MCTIDRGSLTDTVIGEFSSIDNQVQIAHNVKMGSFCIIASQVGIAGSTILGNNVLIGACSLVNSDVEENSVMLGVPAIKISNKGSFNYI